ncbi:MAG: hypothetical protein EXQ56_10735 [Acidobacteria bacterium]|nr:hypothetical protein [Acidobacteriota bacterium]
MEVLRIDQYLRHEAYGLGVVTSSNVDRTTIDFETHGVKKFITSIMVCELLSGQAPNRPKPSKSPTRKAPRTALPKPVVRDN